MAKVEQDIEVEIDIPESLKFKKTIGKIKYKLHEEEVKLIIDIKKIAKEIKRLQEQLKEANEVIDNFRTYDFTVNDEVAEEYQVKWGVKAKRLYKHRKRGVK